MYKMSVGQDAGGRGSSAWERTWRRLLCNAAAALAAVLLYVKPHSMAQSLNVTEKQEPLCQPSSLQSRQISPEYGCEEIQVKLSLVCTEPSPVPEHICQCRDTIVESTPPTKIHCSRNENFPALL